MEESKNAMKSSNYNHAKMKIDKRHVPFYCCFLTTMVMFFGAFLIIWFAVFFADHKEMFSAWRQVSAIPMQTTATFNNCETQFRPKEIEVLPSSSPILIPSPSPSPRARDIVNLPRGIVAKTSDFLMQPLWGPRNTKKPGVSTNLLAMAVGIKQKESVNAIVQKFLLSNFVLMLFHYDGNMNDWREFPWSVEAVHVSAMNQTKWWFAKRFLHPDIIADYSYIFLWDEDLGVEHFNVDRYLSIIKEEGLQISQPALHLNSTEVHHPITLRNETQRVHKKVVRVINTITCLENSTEPPCTGWVEIMAPVFSADSWRCAWHLIQNDLVHAWGLDYLIGYCVQGDRKQNIGVVDSEYIVHHGIPTLGGSTKVPDKAQSLSPPQPNARDEVRKLSSVELEIFKNRWKKAVREDEEWIDPYPKPNGK